MQLIGSITSILVINIGREHDGKIQFTTKARRNGNSLAIILPKPIREHNNIEEGDIIAIQAEFSDEHGEYASFWNESKQEGEQ